MSHLYIICGYGIPKDITKDNNYNFYLKTVFNKIFDSTQKDPAARPFIILSGGKTDCFKPYNRSEAGEMKRSFVAFTRGNSAARNIAKQWRFVLEAQSLSTLENFINSKKILAGRGILKGRIIVFCEQTRERRVKVLTKRIFGKAFKVTVIPIDFDTSPNRYLDKAFIEKKEAAGLRQALTALRSPENLQKHHAVFAEKVRQLREAGGAKHTEAIKKLWEKGMNATF